MNTERREIERLENAFWKSMIDGKPEIAVAMLTEPAQMISGHGINKFNHTEYTMMANNDKYKLIDYKISDMEVTFPRDDVAVATYQVNQQMDMAGEKSQKNVFDSSVWIKSGNQWLCAMHTESPVSQ